MVVSTVPRKGWTGAGRALSVTVVQPVLGPGSRGAAVTALETRLRELGYALRGVDGVYSDDDDQGAVLAFQKVNGLERTGMVDRALWSLLAPRASPPRATAEPRRGRQVPPGAVLRRRRARRRDRPRLDGRDREHTRRALARLLEGRRLELGALVPELLPPRLRDPRVPGGSGLSGFTRLRPRADVDRDVLYAQIPYGFPIYVYE